VKEQYNFMDMENAKRRRKTKRDEFVETMDKVIPWWAAWVEIVKQFA